MQAIFPLLALMLFTACGPEEETEDITDDVFESQAIKCTDYVGTYTSSIQDLASGNTLNGRVEISDNGTTCTFSSNPLPTTT